MFCPLQQIDLDLCNLCVSGVQICATLRTYLWYMLPKLFEDLSLASFKVLCSPLIASIKRKAMCSCPGNMLLPSYPISSLVNSLFKHSITLSYFRILKIFWSALYDAQKMKWKWQYTPCRFAQISSFQVTLLHNSLGCIWLFCTIMDFLTTNIESNAALKRCSLNYHQRFSFRIWC